MARWLRLTFDAPLMSFGGVAVDARGVTDAWPSASLLTGLFANALGWRRTEAGRLQRLQDRLVHACLLLRSGEPLTDFQTAELGADDRGWTTRGAPEGRAGGAGTYAGPHLRWRDHWADRRMAVVARLEPAGEEPDLDAVASALSRPARPLFLGRKACPPSAPLFAGWAEGASAPEALRAVLALEPAPPPTDEAAWPVAEGEGAGRSFRFVDRRDWRSGVHAGWSEWREGPLRAPGAAP